MPPKTIQTVDEYISSLNTTLTQFTKVQIDKLDEYIKYREYSLEKCKKLQPPLITYKGDVCMLIGHRPDDATLIICENSRDSSKKEYLFDMISDKRVKYTDCSAVDKDIINIVKQTKVNEKYYELFPDDDVKKTLVVSFVKSDLNLDKDKDVLNYLFGYFGTAVKSVDNDIVTIHRNVLKADLKKSVVYIPAWAPYQYSQSGTLVIQEGKFVKSEIRKFIDDKNQLTETGNVFVWIYQNAQPWFYIDTNKNEIKFYTDETGNQINNELQYKESLANLSGGSGGVDKPESKKKDLPPQPKESAKQPPKGESKKEKADKELTRIRKELIDNFGPNKIDNKNYNANLSSLGTNLDKVENEMGKDYASSIRSMWDLRQNYEDEYIKYKQLVGKYPDVSKLNKNQVEAVLEESNKIRNSGVVSKLETDEYRAFDQKTFPFYILRDKFTDALNDRLEAIEKLEREEKKIEDEKKQKKKDEEDAEQRRLTKLAKDKEEAAKKTIVEEKEEERLAEMAREKKKAEDKILADAKDIADAQLIAKTQIDAKDKDIDNLKKENERLALLDKNQNLEITSLSKALEIEKAKVLNYINEEAEFTTKILGLEGDVTTLTTEKGDLNTELENCKRGLGTGVLGLPPGGGIIIPPVAKPSALKSSTKKKELQSKIDKIQHEISILSFRDPVGNAEAIGKLIDQWKMVEDEMSK